MTVARNAPPPSSPLATMRVLGHEVLGTAVVALQSKALHELHSPPVRPVVKKAVTTRGNGRFRGLEDSCKEQRCPMLVGRLWLPGRGDIFCVSSYNCGGRRSLPYERSTRQPRTRTHAHIPGAVPSPPSTTDIPVIHKKSQPVSAGESPVRSIDVDTPPPPGGVPPLPGRDSCPHPRTDTDATQRCR